MGPSTTGDMETTRLEVAPTKFAIVRGKMKDVLVQCHHCQHRRRQETL